ncbi:MAG TPA: hypothetical protein VNQ90_14485 [Chthoniobacteraceae bacterium]|nr:hypothetical protein [Chthoniobacteraceae bacterium]
MSTFSERQGLIPSDAEITLRHDAPDWLRSHIIALAYDAGLSPSSLRDYLCKILLEEPDQSNWSEFPNIDGEVRHLLSNAEWFYVYDLIERIYSKVGGSPNWEAAADTEAGKFSKEINRAFRQKGVGWQLVCGKIQMRGAEAFEESLRTAIKLTEQSNRSVARRELSEALRDLSRRPEPEVTGAIQHAMAALECIAKDVTSDPSVTLGAWIKKNPNGFPAPLNIAVEKLWGYASEYGRHVKEGYPASFEEAEMTVGVAGALSTYLLRKASL